MELVDIAVNHFDLDARKSCSSLADSCQNFHLQYIYVNDDNVIFVQDLSIQREITRRNPNEFLIPLIN